MRELLAHKLAAAASGESAQRMGKGAAAAEREQLDSWLVLKRPLCGGDGAAAAGVTCYCCHLQLKGGGGQLVVEA